MARSKEPSIPDALLDQLLSGADPKTAFDPGGLLDGLKKALAERALNAEMDHHLAGENGAGNGRKAGAGPGARSSRSLPSSTTSAGQHHQWRRPAEQQDTKPGR